MQERVRESGMILAYVKSTDDVYDVCVLREGRISHPVMQDAGVVFISGKNMIFHEDVMKEQRIKRAHILVNSVSFVNVTR